MHTKETYVDVCNLDPVCACEKRKEACAAHCDPYECPCNMPSVSFTYDHK